MAELGMPVATRQVSPALKIPDRVAQCVHATTNAKERLQGTVVSHEGMPVSAVP